MRPSCTSVLLNAGELIQIDPVRARSTGTGNRDTDLWPALPPADTLSVVNAIVALDDFTLDNGAGMSPGSHLRPVGRGARPGELARAVMRAGDAILFRGDLVHGGGANTTDARRRAVSLSYCVGWLRTVENHAANLGLDTIDPGAAATPRPPRWRGVHDSSDPRRRHARPRRRSRADSRLGLYGLTDDPALRAPQISSRRQHQRQGLDPPPARAAATRDPRLPTDRLQGVNPRAPSTCRKGSTTGS